MNASLDLSVLAAFQPGSHFTQQQVPLLFSLASVGTQTDHCKVLLIPRAICMQHL